MFQFLLLIHIGYVILIQGVQGVTENEKSKAYTSESRWTMLRNKKNRTISFNDTSTTRYFIPPKPLDRSKSTCKLCNYTWSVPYPQRFVRGQTCSYWNNKVQPDTCLMYQSTLGPVCGCSPVPTPPCPVCDGYGDYIWTLSSSSRTNYIVDQCIQMILDLSKDNKVCSSYRLFVAKICCTQPPVSDVVSSIMEKLPTDDHYVRRGTDDYSYAGPIYDDNFIRFDDYYLAYAKSKKGGKKGPKNNILGKGKKNWKKNKKKKSKKQKKSKWFQQYYDNFIIYSKSKSKGNPYFDDFIYRYY